MNGLLRRTPLRVRLAAAVVGLVAVGLALSGFAATAALHSYLLQRIDSQLETAQVPPDACNDYRQFGGSGPDGGGPGGGGGGGGLFLTQYYVAFYSTSGANDCVVPANGDSNDAPKLPPLTGASAVGFSQHPFTVPAAHGDGSWRVVVSVAQDGDSHAVALSLSDLDHTVNRLLLLEVSIGVIVLALVAGLGYVVIRRSLEPLVDVEHTAAAIAAGDLTRRVPSYDERTEVGRLTNALNGMLAQIERGFARAQNSEAEARTSEERMRRFVADASHELRTPLTSIRGFAELYRQGAVGSETEVARVMSRVEGEAVRMGLLVDDLLLLARLDSERPLDREQVDLLAIATDVAHDARAVAPDRTIVVSHADGTVPIVSGDDMRLRQVVHNLMTNALMHTPEGTPVAVRVGADATTAFVEVEDHGPGLTPEAADRVFERFFRVDASRNREAGGGSGLGLSIVAALVAAHGGSVSVRTKAGEGATFRVELPLAR